MHRYCLTGMICIERMIGCAVGELLAGMEKVVKALDPEALSGPESLELFAAFHRIERLAAAGKALCARQMAATRAWYSGGHRSPCHLMAEATGSSVRHAVDLLDAAEAMRALPATEAKFRAGALTERQVIEVASAAVADPESEEELLELAELESFVELQRAAARVRAAASDDDERHRRAHRRRNFRHWVDVEGSFRFSGSLTAEAGAVLMAAMEPHRQALSRRAAESDKGKRRRRDSDAAVAADALVEMARSAAGSQPGDPLRPTPAAVDPRAGRSRRPGAGTHRAGRGVRGAGGGTGHRRPGSRACSPMRWWPPCWSRTARCSGSPTWAVSSRPRCAPRSSSGTGRAWCRAVRSTADLEIDHIRPVAAGGRSELANLCRLCRFHHYLKTHHGWRISRAGKRWLWEGPHGPPPDPNARQPELAAARG